MKSYFFFEVFLAFFAGAFFFAGMVRSPSLWRMIDQLYAFTATGTRGRKSR
jgi:hypothetical protein